MERDIHLAIIDADIPARELYLARGLYSAQFNKMLQDAVVELKQHPDYKKYNITLHVTAYDLLGGVYPPLDLLQQSTTTAPSKEYGPKGLIDAILITGARAGVYDSDELPWITELEKYIQTVFNEYPRVRILGSCFGHQLIAKALLSNDVIVGKCPLGREAGLFTIKTSGSFMRHFPILSQRPDGMKLQMMHGDWVVSNAAKDTEPSTDASFHSKATRLPFPWWNTGSTDMCPIQGLYHPHRVLTIEGHFELDGFGMKHFCIDTAPSLGWSKEQLDAAVERTGSHLPDYQDDADIMAQVVVLFLAGEEGFDAMWASVLKGE